MQACSEQAYPGGLPGLNGVFGLMRLLVRTTDWSNGTEIEKDME